MWLWVMVFAQEAAAFPSATCHGCARHQGSVPLSPASNQVPKQRKWDSATSIKLKPNYNISVALPEAECLILTHLREFWQNDHWPTFLFRSSACICVFDECFLKCSNINNENSNYRTFVRKRLLAFVFWGKAEANKHGVNKTHLLGRPSI